MSKSRQSREQALQRESAPKGQRDTQWKRGARFVPAGNKWAGATGGTHSVHVKGGPFRGRILPNRAPRWAGVEPMRIKTAY